jgi:hypothetical protein
MGVGTASGERPDNGPDGRACVYTALLGGYERLTEQPVAGESSLDFVCLTDDPTLVSETWTVRLVERIIPRDPARSQRALKIRAHAAVPDYDVSLYIDNSILLKTPPERILAELLPPEAVLAVMAHGFRESVADEFRAVVESGLDAAHRCDEQLAHYLETDPDCLTLRPLKGGLLLRRHHDARVVAAMDLWLTHVLRYSRRDQLSLRYALRATSLEPLVHELDNFDSPYHTWPVTTGRAADSSVWPEPQAELVRMRQKLAAAESALAAMQASRSWRWTSAARGTLARFRLPARTQAISDSASPEPSQAATSR